MAAKSLTAFSRRQKQGQARLRGRKTQHLGEQIRGQAAGSVGIYQNYQSHGQLLGCRWVVPLERQHGRDKAHRPGFKPDGSR